MTNLERYELYLWMGAPICSYLVRLTNIDGKGNNVGVSLVSTKKLNKDKLRKFMLDNDLSYEPVWLMEPVDLVLDEWINQFLGIKNGT